MASGIGLCDSVKEQYDLVRTGKLDWFISAVQLKTKDTPEIIKARRSFPANDEEKAISKLCNSKDYEEYEKIHATLVEEIEENWAKKPAYIVLNARKVTSSGPRSKIVFVQYCPDNSKIKERMVTASSASVMRQSLEGVHHKAEYQSASDFDWKEMSSEIKW